nr:uncharacterized protein LOC104104121 isoform X2 [Nicotiana tomentosiformis]XP_018628928.1 uncharacterized protein LOC104104121 isoform X2 [Nicotiana tomentosiformis]XP_018628929.1 uncharacterized protein LOC104104121 isoform X2 [Nicotiana tomentosiformis]
MKLECNIFLKMFQLLSLRNSLAIGTLRNSSLRAPRLIPRIPATSHQQHVPAALGDNSSGEASSAQQTTLQPIRHPSTGSNKEGQLIPGATIADESSDEDLT